MKYICVNIIRDARAVLMGISILWIMAFHYPFINCSPLIQIEKQGYIGVDIFLFLSGFGLYHSLEKNRRLSNYFHNRFKRIIPHYVIAVIVLLCYWISQTSDMSFLKYVIETWWYTPCMILFYFLSVSIYGFVKQEKVIRGGVIIILYFLLCILYVNHFPWYPPVNLTIGRFPIFVIGMLFGKMSIERKTLKLSYLIILFIIGTILYLVTSLSMKSNSLGILRTVRLFICSIMVPPSVLIIASLLPNKSNLLKRFLVYTGSISFELYLVSVFIWIVMKDCEIKYSFFSVAVYVIGSYILAIGLSKSLKIR